MRLKGFLAIACLTLLASCSASGETEGPGGARSMEEGHPGVLRTEGWLEFADLSLSAVASGKEPRGAHVRGWITGGLFFPRGSVVGIMEAAPRGRVLDRGFLELRTRAFIPTRGERAPRPPYVEGWRDRETGGFHPSSDVRAEAPGGENSP